MEFIQQILQSNFGSFGFVAGIMGLAFWLTHWITKKVTEINNDHSHIGNSIDKLSADFDKTKEDIYQIKAFMEMFRDKTNSLVQRNSPLSLTEKGNKVVDDLKIKDILIKQWDNVKGKIDSRLSNDHNPYDIQEACFDIGRNYSKLLTDSEFDIVKRYAYENGHNLADYDLAFGIVLRTLYFEENNINPKDIDQNDPITNKKYF